MLLDPLEHEIAERLAAAGDRARSSDFTAPDRAFSGDLRDRLMTAASDRASDRATTAPRTAPATASACASPGRCRPSSASRASCRWRSPRLLLIVGVVAARELYVAIGNRPDATPTPSVELVAPSDSADESFVAVESAPASAEATHASPRPSPRRSQRPSPPPSRPPPRPRGWWRWT